MKRIPDSFLVLGPPPDMKRSIFLLPIGFAILLAVNASAVTVATDPVGFANVSLPANSDSYISLPFIRPPVFVGAIQSASGNTMTITGSPGFTGSQFVYAAGSQPNHYYALLGNGGSSNPKEGHTFLVTGNGTNTITVDASVEDLSGVTANTQVTLIPYWTLGTAFPSSDAGASFTATSSSGSYQTQISIPNENANGTDLPYLATYYFSNNVDGTSNNVGWRSTTDNATTSHDDDILLPDSYFVVHNSNGAPTGTLTSLGAVLTKKLAVPLRTSATGQQDNPAGLVRPLDVQLNLTGLNPNDGSFTTADQLLVFNNSQTSFNKSPAIYYRDQTTLNWRLLNDLKNVSDRGNDVIPLGTGFIVRKGQTNGNNVFWNNSFPLQALTAVSRRLHGPSGGPYTAYDINLPLSGNPGVESRLANTPGQSGYQVVVTFPTTVSFTNATLSPGSAGSVSSFSGSGTNTATINLGSITSGQYVTINLTNATDGTNMNDVSVVMGVLVGDTSGDGKVNSADATFTRNNSGKPTDPTNFRADFNADGNVNSADATTVRNRSGTAFP